MKMTVYNMAGFYAETGDKDRALEALHSTKQLTKLINSLAS